MSIHLRGLHPSVRERAELALSWAHRYGLSVTITSGYRSWAEQDRLHREYLAKRAAGKETWPANPPGHSSHNYGLAWDSWVPTEAEWWTWTYLRQMAGFRVPEHDRPHAEVPNWRAYVTPGMIRRG
jgi:D-alanyl-D-alanine carboxypeptidase